MGEFSEYIGGLDYLNGRMLTKSGDELFVGVKEFAEYIRRAEGMKESEEIREGDGE